MTLPLDPLEPETCLMPRGCAFMTRTDLAQVGAVGLAQVNLDSVTCTAMGLYGQAQTVRHAAGTTGPILDFLAGAGLRIAETIHRFHTPDQAEAIADRLVATGLKLHYTYPLRPGRFADDAQAPPPALWRRLNDKARLADLVPAQHLAPRQVLSLAAAGALSPRYPVWVKLGGTRASGGGMAVRRCLDRAEYDAALAMVAGFDAGAPVIVEDEVPVDRTWCASLMIDADRVILLGAAEQVFAAPGRQSGSIIDPSDPMPGRDMAFGAGEAARRLGYRGVFGLDIGRGPQGEAVVFDPNFRINASTPQVALYPAASRRAGLPVSASLAAQAVLPMPEILRRLARPVAEGWFVPVRLIDAALLPATNGRSMINGFTLGRDRSEARAAAGRIGEILA